jgi:hypothetical protein
VTQIAGLAGVPIHATPLYSIGGNLLLGVGLLRLTFLGAPDSLLLGIYLMLAAIARFVEESYRAEPQTAILGGLHTYQWLAVGSLLAGIACTMLPPDHPGLRFEAPDGTLLWCALGMGLLTGFAMGVDFPGSNRRFSRLAAAD